MSALVGSLRPSADVGTEDRVPTDIHEILGAPWAAADELRANSRLKASEYSIPMLGLILLRYADEDRAE